MSFIVLSKPTTLESNDSIEERAGIFDQFSENDGELSYYTVFGNSDCEGNITILDVKKETFGRDVTVVAEDREHSDEDNVDVTGEIERDDESQPVSAQRYGFRTRRLKDHRVQDFDISICESSDESCELEPEYIPTSDDEPYDLPSDNWSRRKLIKGISIKTRKNNQRQSTERRFTQEKQSAPCTMQSTPPEVTSINSNKTQNGLSENKPDQVQSKLTPQKIYLTSVDTHNASSTPLLDPTVKVFKVNSPPIQSFAKKKPNKIRFGYNSTAPKVPEMRPIKRRQLRQPASRTATSTNSQLSDLSSSSEDEAPISMQKRTVVKISRFNDAENPAAAVTKCTEQQVGHTQTQVPKVQNTVISGNGLKLVIRRQSADAIASSIQRIHLERSVSENANTKDDIDFSESKVNVKMNKYAKKLTNGRLEKRKLENKTSTESNNVEGDCPENIGDGCYDHRKIGSNSSTAVNGNHSERRNSQSQPVIDEEYAKKKKSKRKRKKKRGRSGSNASIEDTCDAEYMAMRLTMELPRHNWLIKHLIKEKKLKAEDDKPLNNARETGELNAQSSTRESKQRASSNTLSVQQENQSTKSNSIESEVPSDETQANKISPQEEVVDCEDLRNNQNNYSKGSSMVGIVKPFQHLKMSPANCKDGDTSPSRLCIIEEEEDENELAESSTASAAREIKQINMDYSTCDSDSIVANSNENTPFVIAAPVVVPMPYPIPKSAQTSESMKPAETSTSSNSERSSMTEQMAVEKITKTNDHPLPPPKNGSDENNSRGPLNLTNTTPVALSSEKGLTSDSSTAENETEDEIQVSNCFSLALDLTTKVQVQVEQRNSSHSTDEPLDLSMKSKSGDKFPEILDLSVKKQPRSTNTVVTSSPNTEAAKRKIAQTRLVPSKAVDSTKPMSLMSHSAQEIISSKPTSTKITPSSTDTSNTAVKSFVIVIEDRPEAPITDMKSNPRPSSMPVESLSSPTAPSHKTSKLTPNPMKRCASLDATTTEVLDSPHQLKRPRMSLDDSRLSSSQPTAASTNKLAEIKSGSQHKTRGTEATPVQLLTNPSHHHHTATSIASIHEKPFVVSQSNVPRKHSEKSPIYTMESTPPLVVTQVRPHVAYSTIHRQLPYHTPTPLTPATSIYNGNVVTSSNYSPTTENPAKVCVRSRSLQSTRSQKMTQVYQPVIGTLEPYIKAQQRAVDEKIKELEAFKRHLAEARESNKKNGPARAVAAYPRSPNQMRKHYNPPVQISMPIPKPVITASMHRAQAVLSHSPITHRNPTPIQTNPSHMPHCQQVPSPTLMHGAHLKQRMLPPRWRALPSTHQDRQAFVVRRQLPNGNPAMETDSVRQMQAPRMLSSQNFPRLTNSSNALPGAGSHLPVPRAYSHSVPGLTLQSIPTPRIPTNTPVYRNGGLTVADAYRTQLNDPIVIDDDIAHQTNSHLPGYSPNSTHSLKIRRAYSYHPPLSKNQNQRHAPKAPGSKTPDSKTEPCARCDGKAYFLCSGCRKIWYCNKNCQLQDWSTHSSICSG